MSTVVVEAVCGGKAARSEKWIPFARASEGRFAPLLGCPFQVCSITPVFTAKVCRKCLPQVPPLSASPRTISLMSVRRRTKSWEYLAKNHSWPSLTSITPSTYGSHTQKQPMISAYYSPNMTPVHSHLYVHYILSET